MPAEQELVNDVPAELAAAARNYAKRGWHVMPCDPQTKQPLIERGVHAASTDLGEIGKWWRQFPYAMIGIRTGPESGIMVVDPDVDSDEGIDGFVAIAELEKTHGALPDTLRATTPRGGEHLYFRWHEGVKNSASKIGNNVDVRGRNGFVIAPPSMRSDRKSYQWRENCAPQPAEAPDWLIELLTAPEAPAPTKGAVQRINGNSDRYAKAALDSECAKVAGTPAGQRNHALNVAAFSLGQLVGGGILTEGEVKARLLDAASACGLVQQDGASAANNTIKSGLGAGMKQPRTAPEPTRYMSPAPQASASAQPPPSNKGTPSANDGSAFGYSWRLTWHGEDTSTGGRKWLVLELLPETGVALISGQWGTYKTFIADDLCAAVMTATPFANKQVMRKGGILFLACEGQDEVEIRLTAAFIKHGGTGSAPFAWVQGCPRLLDQNAGKILAAMVEHAAIKMMQDFGLPVAMIVIDTAGKAAGLSKTGELNDDAVAKNIMKTLADASAETGALFVGVAHFGKNVETGTKGSTGFEDDADVVLALLGERGINGVVANPVLCVRKRRNGPNGEELPFQTEEAVVPNGIEKTLTIRWMHAGDDAAAARPKKKDDPWGVKSLRHLRQTMMNILADCGSQQRPYPDGPMVQAVDLEIVRAEFYKGYPATGDEAAKREARKKAFNRAVENAHDKHLIGIRDIGITTFVWLAQHEAGSQAGR